MFHSSFSYAKKLICLIYDQSKLTQSPAEQQLPSGIFGVSLQVSIPYANVAISLTDEHGENFVYGYVPIVVAKCGVFLKEKGLFYRRVHSLRNEF